MYSVAQLKAIFLNYMQAHPFDYAPKELFEPADYILQLEGKRLRPVLVLMGYNLFKEAINPALPIAYAVEVFHNFSLVHDDIMDAASLRRGQATVHEKYDINTGILSGDVMLIFAYQYLLQIEEEELVPTILKIFTKMATEVCIGQQLDMNFESSQSVTISDYLKMIEYKTAVLLACALQMGAVLAKASKTDVQHLTEFGRNIGIAFQLQDDILDTFGNPAIFGKRIGGDILQNKKTYLVLKTLEVATENDKKQLNKLLNNMNLEAESKIAQVKALFVKNNIQELADKLKENYQKKAMQHLQSVGIETERKKILIALTEELLKRKA